MCFVLALQLAVAWFLLGVIGAALSWFVRLTLLST